MTCEQELGTEKHCSDLFCECREGIHPGVDRGREETSIFLCSVYRCSREGIQTGEDKVVREALLRPV